MSFVFLIKDILTEKGQKLSVALICISLIAKGVKSFSEKKCVSYLCFFFWELPVKLHNPFRNIFTFTQLFVCV